MHINLRPSRLVALALSGVAVAAWGIAGNGIAGVIGVFLPEILIGVFAVLLAFMLEPLVLAGMRLLRLRRPWAALVVYAMLAVVIVVIVAAVIGALAGASADLVADLPGLRGRLPELLARPGSALARLGITADPVVLGGAVLDWVAANATALEASLREAALSGLGVFGAACLTFSLAAFISADAPALRTGTLGLLPLASRGFAERGGDHLTRAFGGFVRGQVILGCIYALAVAAISLWAGLPWTPLLALVSGLAMVIPWFGPFIAPLPVLATAVLVDAPAFPIVIALLIVTMLILNLIQPRVMAGAVGLHPVLVIVAVLIGGRLAGPIGSIFALPVAAALVAFIGELRGARMCGSPCGAIEIEAGPNGAESDRETGPSPS